MSYTQQTYHKHVDDKGNGLSSTQPRCLVPPPPLSNIERVKFTNLLRVYISDTLEAGKQIEYMLKICNQRLYLLNQLKKQGLSKHKLNNVLNAIVISRLTYAAAAWREYASSAECNNIQEFLIKAKRWGLISEDINFDDILNVHESKLFKKAQYRSH